jgi:hypothetical protein
MAGCKGRVTAAERACYTEAHGTAERACYTEARHDGACMLHATIENFFGFPLDRTCTYDTIMRWIVRP